MKKRALVLAAVWMLAGFVSLGPGRLPSAPDPAPTSVASQVGRVVLAGIVVALSPVGALVGCGGGGPTGPSRTSATAAALP
jgi:hypothetical protein